MARQHAHRIVQGDGPEIHGASASLGRQTRLHANKLTLSCGAVKDRLRAAGACRMTIAEPAPSPSETAFPYVLDEQVGFILRQVNQRHTGIFAARFGEDLTPTQWAAIAKLHETGPCSQNRLGRLTAMDVATIKGVVDRLAKRGYVALNADPADARRVLVALTAAGEDAFRRNAPTAAAISEETLAPLNAAERATLMRLLNSMR